MPHAFRGSGDNNMSIFNETEHLVIELTDAKVTAPSNISDNLYMRLRPTISGTAAHAIERADRFRKIIERVETFSSRFSLRNNASSARTYCRFEKLVGSMK
jgi:hypothetical protein